MSKPLVPHWGLLDGCGDKIEGGRGYGEGAGLGEGGGEEGEEGDEGGGLCEFHGWWWSRLVMGKENLGGVRVWRLM